MNRLQLAGLTFSLLAAPLMAEQTTSRGRDAVREYKANLQKKNSGATAEPQPLSHKNKMKEKERDHANADQLSKMPAEQRERSAREYRAKRAEQVNRNQRKAAAAESDKSAARKQKGSIK